MQQRNRSKHEMATNNRGRGGRNNNPEGRNQYSGMIGTARANPLSTAAAVGGAVAAGVFLWARRNQISDQLGNLTDQINGWREGMRAFCTDPRRSFRPSTTVPCQCAPPSTV